MVPIDEAWPPPEGFPDRLFRLRRARGVSNPEIAEGAGVHVRTVSNWIGGQVPVGEPLFRLARYFGVNPEWLLTGKGSEVPRVPVKPHPGLKPPKEIEKPKSVRRKGNDRGGTA